MFTSDMRLCVALVCNICMTAAGALTSERALYTQHAFDMDLSITISIL